MIDLKKAIIPILKKNKVKRAAIFGSLARGDAGKKSDMDIVVEFHGKKSLLDLSLLRLHLRQVTKKNIDIITYRSIYPRLRQVILAEQKRIL